MRRTASMSGPVARQNALPDEGSSQARSKDTPSSAWMARSRSCAAWNWAAVTPTNPSWTSMNFGILMLLGRSRGAPPSRGTAVPGGRHMISDSDAPDHDHDAGPHDRDTGATG